MRVEGSVLFGFHKLIEEGWLLKELLWSGQLGDKVKRGLLGLILEKDSFARGGHLIQNTSPLTGVDWRQTGSQNSGSWRSDA